MASPEVNFEDNSFEQGATFTFALSWGTQAEDAAGNPILDGDGHPSCIPYDLAGCHSRLQFRARQNAPVLLTCTDDADDPANLDVGGITLVTEGPQVQPVSHVFASGGALSFTVPDSASFSAGEVISTNVDAVVGTYTITTVPDATTIVVSYTGADLDEDVLGSVQELNWNNIEVVVSDEKSDLLNVAKVVYDLKVYWPDGTEDYVLHGAATVRLRITQDASA
jgi:hypothetical protein